MASPDPFGFSDAARRISDTCRQAITDGHAGRWMAFALADGTSDGTTYDHRADAVRHHANASSDYTYIKVPWDDVTPRAAEVMLMIGRQARAAGMQLTDPEVANTTWMTDNRREAYPRLDRRRLLMIDRVRGLILPKGHHR